MNNPTNKFNPTDQDKIYINENITADISSYNEYYHTNYVGFNPVNVKVPNKTVDATGDKKITENGDYSYTEFLDDVPLRERGDYVGVKDIAVKVPDVSIPKDEPDNPNNTWLNTAVERKENGRYTIQEWKNDPQNDSTQEEKDMVVGFNQVFVNVPNKTVKMNSDIVTDDPNTGTIDRNGTYTIQAWKQENPNIQDKNDYVGFNNIKVNVQPRLYSLGVIRNSGPYRISTYNNGLSDNEKYQGFADFDVQIEGSEDGKELAYNAILQSNNSNVQTIVTQYQDSQQQTLEAFYKTIELSLNKFIEQTHQQYDGFGNAIAVLAENRPNVLQIDNKRLASLTLTSENINPMTGLPNTEFNPQNMLPQESLPQMIEGNPQAVAGLTGVSVHGLIESEQPVNQEQMVPFDYTNTNVDPNYDPYNVQQMGAKRIRFNTRDILPAFSDIKLYSKYIDNIVDYNNTFGTHYYCSFSQKKRVEIEMLDYDSIEFTTNTINGTGDKYENGSYIYDIVDDFIEDVDKNPIIPNDPSLPDGPGHYIYNPIGLRKLKIKVNVPLKVTNEGSSALSGNVDFSGTNNGLLTINSIAIPDTSPTRYYEGVKLPLYVNINGSNFPTVNLYNPYPSNAPLQITDNTETIQSITWDSNNYNGLNTIYYNVNVQPNLINLVGDNKIKRNGTYTISEWNNENPDNQGDGFGNINVDLKLETLNVTQSGIYEIDPENENGIQGYNKVVVGLVSNVIILNSLYRRTGHRVDRDRRGHNTYTTTYFYNGIYNNTGSSVEVIVNSGYYIFYYNSSSIYYKYNNTGENLVVNIPSKYYYLNNVNVYYINDSISVQNVEGGTIFTCNNVTGQWQYINISNSIFNINLTPPS